MLTLSMHDAKLQYIRNWQALQDFGVTYFLVKVGRSRKEVSKNLFTNLITPGLGFSKMGRCWEECCLAVSSLSHLVLIKTLPSTYHSSH